MHMTHAISILRIVRNNLNTNEKRLVAKSEQLIS